MSKESLTQSYQMYPKPWAKAQFSDQFYMFFSTTFSTLFHNFVDDNNLANFGSTLKELLPILESKCEATAINWLHNNKMILNPDRFQVILLDKCGSG